MPAPEVEVGHLLAAAPAVLVLLRGKAQPQTVEGGVLLREAQGGAAAADGDAPDTGWSDQ